MSDLTPLGALLEQAREARGLSKREAARRAGISDGRWRQVVSGEQKSGELTIPVNPRASTVISMARAVGVDEGEALRAAGLPEARTEEPRRVIMTESSVELDLVERLIAEIYANRSMPEERKHELVRLIRRAEAAREAEMRAARDELAAWSRRRAAG